MQAHIKIYERKTPIDLGLIEAPKAESLKREPQNPSETKLGLIDPELTYSDSPSGARELQIYLEEALLNEWVPESKPIAFGWTLLGLSIFCGLFWSMIAHLWL